MGWYITEGDKIVYEGWTYGECNNMVKIWAFNDELKPIKRKFVIRFMRP